MKALTVRQPWASLIAVGAKRVETRGWSMGHRGPLAFHAGMHAPDAAKLAQEPFRTALKSLLEYGPLPLGAIVAVALVIDVGPIVPELIATLSIEERTFGDYRPGRWAWRLVDVQPLIEPVPARGALGLWTWDAPGSLLEMAGTAPDAISITKPYPRQSAGIQGIERPRPH